jgi:KTSC domain
MTTNRVTLESSALNAVTFSPEMNVLKVEFRNGLIYEYRDVSRCIYEQLLTASSKGAFFGRFIRNCFPSRRVARPRA